MIARLFPCLGVSFVILPNVVIAESRLEQVPTYDEVVSNSVTLAIPCDAGTIEGRMFSLAKPLPPLPRLVHFRVLYLPKSGHVWAGSVFEDQQILHWDRIYAFRYDYWNLSVSVSTNREQRNLENLVPMLDTQSKEYLGGRGRYSGDPRFVLRILDVFGHDLMWLPRSPEVDGSPEGFEGLSALPKPSRLAGVSVENTNIVVAVEIGTNLMAKIAFTPQMVPVWASTNGVRLGPLPTNTVHYIGVKADGHREIRVVY